MYAVVFFVGIVIGMLLGVESRRKQVDNLKKDLDSCYMELKLSKGG